MGGRPFFGKGEEMAKLETMAKMGYYPTPEESFKSRMLMQKSLPNFRCFNLTDRVDSEGASLSVILRIIPKV